MTEYDKQAQDFLEATNSTLKIDFPEAHELKDPLWHKPSDEPMQQYRVTLSTARGYYTFDFWDSIHNTEILRSIDTAIGDPNPASTAMMRVQRELLDGKHVNHYYLRRHRDELIEKAKPGAYAVLACLDPDYSDNFVDFCANYGYDTDSITAERTYAAVIEQDRQLRRMFTSEELEKLQEIN